MIQKTRFHLRDVCLRQLLKGVLLSTTEAVTWLYVFCHHFLHSVLIFLFPADKKNYSKLTTIFLQCGGEFLNGYAFEHVQTTSQWFLRVQPSPYFKSQSQRMLKGLLYGHKFIMKTQLYFYYNQKALKDIISSELCTHLLLLKCKHR